MDIALIFAYLPWVAIILVIAATLYYLRHKPDALFYTLAAEFFILGCILLTVTPPHANVEFAHSLADALIIAAILGATVDSWVKKRLVREVTEDVSKFLIGYRLPIQVQDRIRSLTQTEWIRRKFDVRMRLTETNGGQVELDFTVSNQVQNITSETQEFTDILTFRRPENFAVREMRCSRNGADVYHFENDRVPRQEDGMQVRHTGRRVKVRPVDSEDREELEFSVRYRVGHPDSSVETITFSQPTIGASIQLTDCPNGYQIHLSPTPDQSGHHRWIYDRLFWPGEQITIQWQKDAQGAR